MLFIPRLITDWLPVIFTLFQWGPARALPYAMASGVRALQSQIVGFSKDYPHWLG